MTKFLVIITVGMHSLVHLLGFGKAFGLAEIKELSLPISKLSGTLWLIAGVLLLASLVLFLLKKEYWWMIAGSGVLLSQYLVFHHWADAKYGSIINIVLLAVTIAGYGQWQFHRRFNKEAAALLAAARNDTIVLFDPALTASLPLPVQQWLTNAKVNGQPIPQCIHSFQKGEMRTSRTGKWIPFEAEQYHTIFPPAFTWRTTIKPWPGVLMQGQDNYVNGKGNMRIKLFGFLPIANAKGMPADQGAMLRYLSEMIRYPAAAVSSYIQWEPIDDRSAKATMTYGGISASGIFHFNAAGEPSYFEALRFYDRGKQKATLEKWVPANIPGAMREVNGVRIPAKTEVTWELKDGYFTWLKLELTTMQYDEQVNKG